MLNRLSDFYRIVNPEPSDALITQRREAIVSFLEQLSKRELQYACVDIAAFGLGPSPSTAQAEAAKAIIAAIQVPQPSFSSDIGANVLDVRVFAGVALGEYLLAQTETEAITAALVISALGTRVPPQERYLAEFVLALQQVAQGSIEAAGRAGRERPELDMDAFQGTDVPTITRSINDVLNKFKDAVDKNLRADREELQVLWWVFGGYSTRLGEQFESLDLPQRILASATELADLVIVPPMKASNQFLNAVLREDRPLTLRHLIEPLTSVVLESVAGRRAQMSVVLSGNPALLPLSWLCCRRLESGMVTGWEGEFEQKTHISVSDERSASSWARQVFNECVVARLLAAGVEDLE